MKKIVFLFFLIIYLFASITSNDKYLVFENKDYSIIYTKENEKVAYYINYNLPKLLKFYEKEFNYKLTNKINIVLITPKIELPNGFTTIIPFNEIILYNGSNFYFSYLNYLSYIDILLAHEVSHMYQLNVKDKISKKLNKYLGNNFLPIVTPIPIFTYPNLFLPPFILEGFSVYNEENLTKGRLSNPRNLALFNILLKHNKITLKNLLNNSTNFKENSYILGAFFAKSLEKNKNIFFKEHSKHYINPFLLNKSFKEYFNISLESAFRKFIDKKVFIKEFIGEIKSKKEIFLSKYDKIYFITHSLHNYPKLYTFNKKFISQDTKLKNKVFKINNKLYSNSVEFISPTRYKIGLFDKNNYILKKSLSKVIFDTYKDSLLYTKPTYFNIPLYKDNIFIDNINSNALFDENGNIYYFKQIDNYMVLFKNKKEIFRFKGAYAKLCDITDSIYFSARAKNGISIYKLNKNLYKLPYDNLIDFKEYKGKKFVVAINSDSYSVGIIKDNFVKANLDDNYKINNFFQKKYKIFQSKQFNEFKDLRFSFLYPFLYSNKKSTKIGFNALFSDRLLFNTLDIFISKDSYISYTNERIIPYNIKIQEDEDEYLYSFLLYGPLLKKGRNTISARLNYYIDNLLDRKPIVASLDYVYLERFDKEIFDSEFLLNVNYAFLKYKDFYTNKFLFNIDKKFFNINFGFEYQRAKSDDFVELRYENIKDDTNILVEGLENNLLVKEVTKNSFKISKRFYKGLYFKAPISVEDFTLFFTKNYYDTKDFSIKEDIIGINNNLLLFYKVNIPLIIEYIKNDYSKNREKYIIKFGLNF